MSGSKLKEGKVIAALVGLIVVATGGGIGAEAAGTWEEVAPAPGVFSSTAPVTTLDGKIYALCGSGGCNGFWRYDPQSDSWTTLAPLPEFTHSQGGSNVCAAGGLIYANPGGFYRNFYSYDPSTDGWTLLGNIPANGTLEFGTSMVWTGGNFIYLHHRDPGLMRYDIVGNSWSNLGHSPLRPWLWTGSTLVYTGGDHLYLNQGHYWAEPGVGLLRYTISSGDWEILSPSPALIFSGMVWDGGDFIYGRTGYYNPDVHRYSISADTWDTVEPIPVSGMVPDFRLAMAGGAFYTARERGSNAFLRLSLNEPPVALCMDPLLEAGPGCEAPASVDAGSYDPDGDDFVITEDPTGPYGLGETDVELTIEDVFGAADSCVGTVEVVDTVAPTAACNTPATITPRDAPVSFSASMDDLCGGSIAINGYDCWMINGAGKRVSKLGSCVVATAGDTVTILESGGVGDTIEWSVEATDPSGNSTEITCKIEVVNPGKGPRKEPKK